MWIRIASGPDLKGSTSDFRSTKKYLFRKVILWNRNEKDIRTGKKYLIAIKWKLSFRSGEQPDSTLSFYLDIPYPDVKAELHRGIPLVKWFLALPHLIMLCFLYITLVICTIISWFAILFTGKYPRGLFDFVVGVIRWSLRVSVYAFLLTTDRYPPFTLSE